MHNLFQIKNLTIFAFSDTHGNHRRLQVPVDAEIIICAGDDVEVLEPRTLRNSIAHSIEILSQLYK